MLALFVGAVGRWVGFCWWVLALLVGVGRYVGRVVVGWLCWLACWLVLLVGVVGLALLVGVGRYVGRSLGAFYRDK